MKKEFPFYIKAPVIMLGLVIAVFILSVLRDILVPLAFATLIAILLNPLSVRLERKLPKILSIMISMIIALLVVVGIAYFLSSQIAHFFDNVDAMKQKFTELLYNTQAWLEKTFGIGSKKQVQMIKEAANNSKAVIGQTLSGALGILSVVFLIPVYTFLIMLYKTLILNFFYEVFSTENQQKVGEILAETKAAIQSYIVGLLIETGIVAVMNSCALLILGVPNAILIGVIGAILNLLPYIGGIIAIALPVLMATISFDGYTTQLLIIAAYALIQFIDNNLLVPKIVSSKVQINALVSIVIVLMGAAVWGVPGMFLSIPFIAVLKIIFDRIDELKPWGKLLGDNIPTEHLGQLKRLRRGKTQVVKNT
ncbi:putative PurR-regulated permease PerM [Pedobacter psychrotolerans]|uniref:AI-2E family transporter n=1 Tax=Pedobacter psychrotolerans TaxID=1843235 RepID=A0A4R2HJD6_9SPHI|nr:AI-2E family transporter [Pedobacter psychrotolerans]TCO29099.1 putative PurR-regulated permease PerM [Pedobacter psychrotolerans]GGE54175.1 AI-2E family transporter [Pedobacter psychrotolerans]